MKNYTAVGAAAVIIVSAAIVQGFWTGRWGVDESAELRTFADHLANVPMTIGDWEGTDMEEMDARERQIAGATGALNRRYKNRLTAQVVSLYLVSGNFRNIAVHTPDQCYVAAGFTMLNQPIQYSENTDAGKVDCYTTVFKKEDHAATQMLRVFWTWSFDGVWQAPNLPRVAMVGKPALYKMYLINEVSSPGQAIEETPSYEFMQVLMPELNAALFPASESDPAANADQGAAPAEAKASA